VVDHPFDFDLAHRLTLGAQYVGPEAAPPGGDAAEAMPVLTNFEEERRDGKVVRLGLPAPEILEDWMGLTGGWPRRVGDRLFVRTPGYEARFLDNANQVFAWLEQGCFVQWARGTGLITMERFVEYLRQQAEPYAALELLPHHPPRPQTYYLHPPLPEATGRHLEALLDRFCPATAVDRCLLRAFALSLFWGGEPGARPVWLFTGPDRDPEQGRGVGKSTVVKVFGALAGGVLDVVQEDDLREVKTRLLSPEGLPLRLVRLDNVKSTRLSWADLEGLVTAEVVSGRRLYAGEGRRPNLLTWALTVNGASLSKDLAQRCVVARVARPAFAPGWEEATLGFVREHRWEIIADVLTRLQGGNADG
jgi:hypothetical protein